MIAVRVAVFLAGAVLVFSALGSAIRTVVIPRAIVSRIMALLRPSADFNGWRVNYDRVLIALAGLTMAPYAPWSSDRSIRDWRPRAALRELRRAS